VVKQRGEEDKLAAGLHKLHEEDPTFHFEYSSELGQTLIHGMGERHFDTILNRLERKFGVHAELVRPRVAYRETLKGKAEGQGKHKKQTGGRGQFADTWMEVRPQPRGEGFEFVNKIVGGAIPRNFIPAVEEGVRDALKRGPLGFPIVDVKVTLNDGQYHDVDSSELAFKIAGSLGFKDAMQKAKPTILEPMMKVEITTSDEFMGDIMSDLSQRRGRPSGMENKGHHNVITAVVPMAEMLNYAPALRAMTQGRSDFHMEYTHYEEVPRPVQEKLIAEAAKRKQEEHEQH